MAHHRPNNLRKKRQELAEAFRVQEQPTGIIMCLGRRFAAALGGRLDPDRGARPFSFQTVLDAPAAPANKLRKPLHMSEFSLLDRGSERHGVVVGVFAKQTHGFAKEQQKFIRLLRGWGSRVTPTQDLA